MADFPQLKATSVTRPTPVESIDLQKLIERSNGRHHRIKKIENSRKDDVKLTLIFISGNFLGNFPQPPANFNPEKDKFYGENLFTFYKLQRVPSKSFEFTLILTPPSFCLPLMPV
jgi:hypothetical protein